MDNPDSVKGIGPLTTPTQTGTVQRRHVGECTRQRFARLLETEPPGDRSEDKDSWGAGNDEAADSRDEPPTLPASPPWFRAGGLALPALLGPAGGKNHSAPEDLRQLLEDVCSSLHLAAGQADGSHMLIGLGSELPGAAVELRREGGFLHVRLHAGDHEVLAQMQRQQDALLAMLQQASSLEIRLEITRDEA
ncbi:MAG: hypothetical protein JJU06_13455 [Ectothiorhodospiraceae bacterium]|nr:hypothetical protein [Ectothiorhodospiraceae bacterium]MCH8503880.1 hypothetical protein [Ectothiorhodospiraceae bacterium]